MNISPLKTQASSIRKIKNVNFASNNISSTNLNSQNKKTNTKTSDFVKKALVFLGVVLNALANLIKDFQAWLSKYTAQDENMPKEAVNVNEADSSKVNNNKITTSKDATKKTTENTAPTPEETQKTIEKTQEKNIEETTEEPNELEIEDFVAQEKINKTTSQEEPSELGVENSIAQDEPIETETDEESIQPKAEDSPIQEETNEVEEPALIQENQENETEESIENIENSNETTDKETSTRVSKEKFNKTNNYEEIKITRTSRDLPENQRYIQASKVLKQEAIDLFNIFDKKLSKSATLSKNPIKRMLLSGKDDLEFDFAPTCDNDFATYKTDSAKYKISFTNEGILDITKITEDGKVNFKYRNNRLKDCAINQNKDKNHLEKGSYIFNYITGDGSLIVKKFDKPISL